MPPLSSPPSLVVSRPPLAVVQPSIPAAVDTRSDETHASTSTSTSEGSSRLSLRNYSASTDTSESSHGGHGQSVALSSSSEHVRKGSSRTLKKPRPGSYIDGKSASSSASPPSFLHPRPNDPPPPLPVPHLNIALSADDSFVSVPTSTNDNESPSTPTAPPSTPRSPNLLRRRSPAKPTPPPTPAASATPSSWNIEFRGMRKLISWASRRNSSSSNPTPPSSSPVASSGLPPSPVHLLSKSLSQSPYHSAETEEDMQMEVEAELRRQHEHGVRTRQDSKGTLGTSTSRALPKKISIRSLRGRNKWNWNTDPSPIGLGTVPSTPTAEDSESLYNEFRDMFKRRPFARSKSARASASAPNSVASSAYNSESLLALPIGASSSSSSTFLPSSSVSDSGHGYTRGYEEVIPPVPPLPPLAALQAPHQRFWKSSRSDDGHGGYGHGQSQLAPPSWKSKSKSRPQQHLRANSMDGHTNNIGPDSRVLTSSSHDAEAGVSPTENLKTSSAVPPVPKQPVWLSLILPRSTDSSPNNTQPLVASPAPMSPPATATTSPNQSARKLTKRRALSSPAPPVSRSSPIANILAVRMDSTGVGMRPALPPIVASPFEVVGGSYFTIEKPEGEEVQQQVMPSPPEALLQSLAWTGRPNLPRRRSSTSHRRWTLAVSEIPDDEAFVEEFSRQIGYFGPPPSAPPVSTSTSIPPPVPSVTSRPSISVPSSPRPGHAHVHSSSTDAGVGVGTGTGVGIGVDEAAWMKARRAMLLVREIIRTERSYQVHLVRALEGKTHNPSLLAPLLRTQLTILVGASKSLTGRIDDDPSAWGVSSAFIAVEEEIEKAFVGWCTVAGQIVTELQSASGSGDAAGESAMRRWGRRSFISGSSSAGPVPGPSASSSSLVPTTKEKQPSLIAGGAEDSTEQKEPAVAIRTSSAPPAKTPLSKQVKPVVLTKAARPSSAKSTPQPISPTPQSPSPSASAAPKVKLLTVQDIAIMPSQRVPRYVMLYRDLLIHTPTTSPSHPLVDQALQAAMRIAQRCNDAQQHERLSR